MNWAYAKDVAATIQSVLTSIGLLVAAFWAYWRFVLQAERETSISSKLQVTVLSCEHGGHRLIEVRNTLTNNGKVPCQIDLVHSSLLVSHVRLGVEGERVSWGRQPYLEKVWGSQLLNVPVGASMEKVEFLLVPHPGVYHVWTFFAQTERDAKVFYKRLHEPVPKDIHDHRPGWPNAAVVSTHTPNTISA